MTIKLRFTLFIHILVNVNAIWPPAYTVHLTDEETFVIAEEEKHDSDDIVGDEDEMIKNHEIKQFNINSDNRKYERLHQFIYRRNREAKQDEVYNKKFEKPKELNYDENEDFQPVQSGFVIINDTQGANANQTNGVKREDYDYAALKEEYDKNVKTLQNSNENVNFTQLKEDDSLKDSFKAVIHPKPVNCSLEERKGIGLGAVKCIYTDLKKSNLSKTQQSLLFRRIATIILIWILVYLLVAVPCWCQRGWCCCCFQCTYCRPHARIDKAKKYLLDNPVGVCRSPTGEIITHQPTSYEKYAQKRLEQALMQV